MKVKGEPRVSAGAAEKEDRTTAAVRLRTGRLSGDQQKDIHSTDLRTIYGAALPIKCAAGQA